MNIEFVEPRLPSRRAWLVVLSLATLAAVLFAAARVMHARADALEDERRMHALAAARPAPVAAPRPAPAYQADALRALDRAALPEAQALGELEAVAVAGIALQSIDVNAAEHVVAVELQSSSRQALDDYLDQLNAGLAIPAWRIQRVSATAAAGGHAPAGSAPAATQSVTLMRRF